MNEEITSLYESISGSMQDQQALHHRATNSHHAYHLIREIANSKEPIVVKKAKADLIAVEYGFQNFPDLILFRILYAHILPPA